MYKKIIAILYIAATLVVVVGMEPNNPEFDVFVGKVIPGQTLRHREICDLHACSIVGGAQMIMENVTSSSMRCNSSSVQENAAWRALLPLPLHADVMQDKEGQTNGGRRKLATATEGQTFCLKFCRFSSGSHLSSRRLKIEDIHKVTKAVVQEGGRGEQNLTQDDRPRPFQIQVIDSIGSIAKNCC
ncbi:hypothetical protein BJV74DRAFT_797632 [Russula compacta]|nr:hypothetical protein BJV74DRAFT_797632 [Russula compacta]